MTHILMLCHDQYIDRRIIAQANSLTRLGHKVTLLALSHTNENSEEHLPQGIHLFRVGLANIIPENKIYNQFVVRQFRLTALLNALHDHFPFAQSQWNFCFRAIFRVNRILYKLLISLRYLNHTIGDPLPFKRAFVTAGLDFMPDLIQVHDLPTLEAGAELAKKKNIPLIYDAHELYPEQRTFSCLQRQHCIHQEKKLIPFCKVVFTVNDSIAKEMANRYNIPQPTVLINAIDPPDTFNSSISYNLLREKLHLPSCRRILLFQGGFSRYRNLELLIYAMKWVKSLDVDLILMGFGDYEINLKNKAKKLGLLNTRVYFLPAVSQTDLLQHTASADMGIIPYPHVDLNSYYCTPNKLFEFIQAGLPILANDSPELRRFIHDEGFGMVNPMRSARQIAFAIDKAFNSPSYSMWKKNLKKRRSLFTWQAQSHIYLKEMHLLFNSLPMLMNRGKN